MLLACVCTLSTAARRLQQCIEKKKDYGWTEKHNPIVAVALKAWLKAIKQLATALSLLTRRSAPTVAMDEHTWKDGAANFVRAIAVIEALRPAALDRPGAGP